MRRPKPTGADRISGGRTDDHLHWEDDMSASMEQAARADGPLDLPVALEGIAGTLRAGRTEDALSAAEALVERNPGRPEAWFALAVAQQRAGATTAAITSAEQAHAIRPAHLPHALFLGKAYRDAGRLVEAEAVLARALERAPRNAAVLLNLAQLRLMLDRREPGLVLFRRALAVGLGELTARLRGALHLPLGLPAMARALLGGTPPGPAWALGRGVGAEHAGRPAVAAAHYRRVLADRPEQSDALAGLGRSLVAEGAFEAAIVPLETAVVRRPRDLGTLVALGTAHLRCHRPEAAAEILSRALAIAPASAAANAAMGWVRYRQRAAGDAIAHFTRALDADRRLADAAFGIGRAAQSQGAFATAASWFDRTLALAPKHAGCLVQLADGPDLGRDEELLARLARLVEDDRLDAAVRMQAHFAAGAIRDRQGDPDGAFGHWRAANRLADVTFSAGALRAHFDALIAAFDRPFFARTAGFGIADPRPVFVVGTPRSGTTLVEQILAAHGQAEGVGELDDVGQLVRGLPALLGGGADYPACLTTIGPDEVQALAGAHLERLDALAPAALRVVDKMGANYAHLGLIALMLPGARIVHCVRDPRDVGLSMYRRGFPGDYPYAYDLTHLGQFFAEYRRLMAHWRAVLPVPMLEVAYEDLIAAPEPTMRRIVDFCGLDWDPACLAFHEQERVVITSSQAQVRQPLYQGGIGQWRRYERHLTELQAALGTAG